MRWRGRKLSRTRDRGKSWHEIGARLPDAHPIAAAAAAGREIVVALGTEWSKRAYSIQEYVTVLRSTDDGKSFAPLAPGEAITAFAPGENGWLAGTILHGIVRVPFAAR